MVERQRALVRARGRARAIEPGLQNGVDRAVGARPYVEPAIARRFEAIAPVLARQPEDAEAGPEALLGVRFALQDQGDEPACGRADGGRLALEALEGPIGIAPMGTRHVLGHGRVSPAQTAAPMNGNWSESALKRVLTMTLTTMAVSRIAATMATRTQSTWTFGGASLLIGE